MTVGQSSAQPFANFVRRKTDESRRGSKTSANPVTHMRECNNEATNYRTMPMSHYECDWCSELARYTWLTPPDESRERRGELDTDPLDPIRNYACLDHHQQYYYDLQGDHNLEALCQAQHDPSIPCIPSCQKDKVINHTVMNPFSKTGRLSEALRVLRASEHDLESCATMIVCRVYVGGQCSEAVLDGDIARYFTDDLAQAILALEAKYNPKAKEIVS